MYFSKLFKLENKNLILESAEEISLKGKENEEIKKIILSNFSKLFPHFELYNEANYKKDVFSNPPFTAEELFEKMEEIGREMKTLVQATEGSFYFDEGWLSSSLLESEEGCQKIKEFVEGEVSDRLREKVNQHTEISSLPELNQ
ncbi:23581_t:CDS:2 [Gigaspora margarita]|uniref:23581_t:CDS:1 n=1 Tax=Gigaspora margarita TaxID=4874 RepID=A0ABM8VZ30_GIGMA|nr:23581_t:CDS:2 [Gigaspora margarita]